MSDFDIQLKLGRARTHIDEFRTKAAMQEIPASVQSTINSINLELRKSDERNRRKPQTSVRAGAAGISRRKPSSRVTPNDTKSQRGGSAQLTAYALF